MGIVGIKKLKTQQNIELSVDYVCLPKVLKSQADELLRLRGCCPCPTSALLTHGGRWSPILIHVCKLCGQGYICSCFKKGEQFIAPQLKRIYVDRPGVCRYLNDNWSFRDKICQLCNEQVPQQEFTSPLYVSKFMSRYSPWIYMEAFVKRPDLFTIDWLTEKQSEEKKMLLRKIENEFREEVGVFKIGERWVSETLLFKAVEAFYQGRYEVQHHARPEHLEGQEYDIFIPEINVAIEYDGVQHDHPVQHFGGEEGFKATQKRDKEKNRKAQQAGVTLIRVKEGYDFDKLIGRIEKII